MAADRQLDNGYLEVLEAVAGWSRAHGEGARAFDPTHRRELTEHFAWGIPDVAALETIERVARDRGVLEVGAGTGYWAALLREMGVDVVATDAAPPDPTEGAEHNQWHPHAGCFTEVVRMDAATAAASAGDRVLLLCWPPSINDMGYEAVAAYPGDTVIYVGEWEGATGTPPLHELLSREWRLEESAPVPVWSGRRDVLMVFRRA